MYSCYDLCILVGNVPSYHTLTFCPSVLNIRSQFARTPEGACIGAALAMFTSAYGYRYFRSRRARQHSPRTRTLSSPGLATSRHPATLFEESVECTRLVRSSGLCSLDRQFLALSRH